MKNILLLFGAFLIHYNSIAQTYVRPTEVPRENKNGQANYTNDNEGITINQFTGIANINVPIGNINYGGVEIPINVSYNANGVRVDQYASSVGLGWNLSAGSVIRRTRRGLFDTDYNKAANVSNNIRQLNMLGFLQKIVEGDEDSEPDIYTISGLGFNSEFLASPNGCVLLGNADIRIRCEVKPNFPSMNILEGDISKFEVSDSRNITYIYEAIETTKSNGSYSTTTSLYPPEQVYDPYNYRNYTNENIAFYKQSEYVTAWHLTEIILPDDTSKITFKYISSSHEEYTFSGYHIWNFDGKDTKNAFRSFHIPTITQAHIQEIKWPGGKYFFSYSGRRDYTNYNALGSPGPGSTFSDIDSRLNPNSTNFLAGAGLNEIVEYDSRGLYNKKHKFYHRYSIGDVDDRETYRYMLDSIVQFGRNYEKKPAYMFVYQDLHLSRLSPERDYQGFCRGDTYVKHQTQVFIKTDTAKSLIPKFEGVESSYDNSFQATYDNPTRHELVFEYDQSKHGYIGDFKNVKLYDSQNGILKGIIYPTDKRVALYYAPHWFYGGGLRTVGIITNDYRKYIADRFDYRIPINYLIKPVFTKTWHFRPNIVPDNNPNANYNPMRVKAHAFPLNEMETVQGSACIYINSSRSLRNGGHKEFKYDYPTHNRYNAEPVNTYDPGGILNTSFKFQDRYPYPRTYNMEWERGQLLEEKEFDSDSVLLKKTSYNYTTLDQDLQIYGTVCKIYNDERFDAVPSSSNINNK